jgi:hypothetical protein
VEAVMGKPESLHVPANGWRVCIRYTDTGRERRTFVSTGTCFLDDLLKAVR